MQRTVESWLNILRQHRSAATVPAYVILYAACLSAAFLLRYDFELTPPRLSRLRLCLPLFISVHLLGCLLTKEWRRTYRYSSLTDVVQAMLGVAGGVLTLEFVNVLHILPEPIPHSIILIDAILSVLATCILRGALRTATQWNAAALRSGTQHRTAVLGDSAEAMNIVRALQTSEQEFRIVGFIVDTHRNDRRLISGVRVISLKRGIGRILRRLRATRLLVPGSTVGRDLQQLISICAPLGVKVHVIPAVDQVLDGRYRLAIREVTISDLLRREPTRLDMDGIRGYVAGKRVLVTGGAGSIGSELCRQILALNPERLVVVDQSEFGVFTIQQELDLARTDSQRHYVVADIFDATAIERTFAEHRPQIVFHAAAYKHVPLLEDLPQEAIRNNVFGTKRIADTAAMFHVERFVMISTDKAVRPTSVMGSTKLLAEKYVQTVARRCATQFLTVRFGNVLNSAGSVVPTFRRQIEAGGPVTVTHPEIERFFMTIPEAVQLVLQAGAIGTSGDVMILDMGEPVKIVDLARDMIQLSGLRCPEDIDIVFTGLRPGEKLYEELFYESQDRVRRLHEKILSTSPETATQETIARDLADLEAAIDSDRRTAATVLREIAARHATAVEPVPTDSNLDSSITVPFLTRDTNPTASSSLRAA